MRLTHRYWATASLVPVLSVGAVVLDQPVLLFGAALVGGWLLARQYAFIDELRTTIEHLHVSQRLERDRVAANTPVAFTLLASLGRPSSLGLRVQGGVPTTAESHDDAELGIVPGGREARKAIDLEWDIAGTFEFQEATVTAADPYGMFTEEISLGETPKITVEAGGPRSVHLGRAGDRIRRALGQHESDPLNVGLEPEEVREYVPGDTVRMIDWKATARLDSPHVRTFESETDRTIALVVDSRAEMGRGVEGETKLDYARHAALLFLSEARANHDPLGLYTVDEDGTAHTTAPTATNRGYAAIRAQLYELETSGVPPDGHDNTRKRRQRPTTTLKDDNSTFARTLRTYLSRGGSRSRDTTGKPLLSTVRSNIERLQGTIRTVIVTDDTDESEVYEAAMAARRGNNRVLVVLAPSVLFGTDGVGDLSTAYRRYQEFETFRRSIASVDRVDAIELAPGDRLSAVLSAGRRGRATNP